MSINLQTHNFKILAEKLALNYLGEHRWERWLFYIIIYIWILMTNNFFKNNYTAVLGSESRVCWTWTWGLGLGSAKSGQTGPGLDCGQSSNGYQDGDSPLAKFLVFFDNTKETGSMLLSPFPATTITSRSNQILPLNNDTCILWVWTWGNERFRDIWIMLHRMPQMHLEWWATWENQLWWC